ncbi:MAG: threonine aldolase family protein [Candidatus Heimdallarchaeota archaeon]
MRIVDLRSDTKTLPTEEMLEAIRTAELGDDVDREDPTVNRVEELAAKKLGKEAGLLVTSGTQGNLVSIMTHTKHGDEIFVEKYSHLYNNETGAFAAIAGCIPHTLNSNRGAIDPEELKKAIRPPNIHFAKPTLVCIENTHNRWGGAVIRPEQVKAIAEVAQNHDLAVHCDGARIFNAAVALKTDVKNLVIDCDSVMFCVSKGLSAPIGSLVVGSSEFIEKARRNRKLLGGGMRQAGIIAAPAIIAIEQMVDRLREDHENARILGEGLEQMGVFDLLPVETNIIIFELAGLGISTPEFVNKLKAKGILAYARKQIVRFVTRRGVTRDDVTYALAQIEDIVTDLVKP